MKNVLKKLYLSLLLSAFIPSLVWAAEKEVELKTYFKPGGNVSTVVNMLVEELPKRGWKVDLKRVENCALLRSVYEGSKKPIMVVWASDRLIDGTNACALPLVEKEFIHTAYSRSDFMCTSRKDIKSVKDMRNPNRPIKLGIRKDPTSRALAADFISKGKLNLSLVNYENSGALNKALASGEVDAIISSAGPKLVKEKKAHCLFVTNDTPIAGARPVAELAKDFPRANLKYIFYLMAKGLPTELQEQFRQDVSAVIAGEKWKKWIAQNTFSNVAGSKAGLEAVKQSVRDLQ